jgi:hypothetical protein
MEGHSKWTIQRHRQHWAEDGNKTNKHKQKQKQTKQK